LGLFAFCGTLEWQVPFEEYPAADAGATACADRASNEHAGKPLSKFHHPRTNRLRASQNGAVLLFDPGTVDIRRVGTQI
jgi:hypothetical protein